MVATFASANTITVTSVSVVGGVFTYMISEDAGGRIGGVGIAPSGNSTPFNSAGTLVDDYFTIYDFAGFTGAHVDPAGWSFCLRTSVRRTTTSSGPIARRSRTSPGTRLAAVLVLVRSMSRASPRPVH